MFLRWHWSFVAPSLVLLAAVLIVVPARSSAHAQAAPPARLAAYDLRVVATHFLGERAYQAEHYVKKVNDDVLHGIVFVADEAAAPAVELEWIISERLYASLSPEDQQHWHPLGPMIAAGRASLPDLSPEEAAKTAQAVATMYAQTINVGGIDGGLPRGLPSVAMVSHLAPAEAMSGHGR